MRSYGQYCGLAKALDVVGDRWTLLIVRELLISGSCRYTELRNGLPGIATNLLVNRLRELEVAGIVSREEAPPPIATTLFQLTSRGRDLESAVHQLGLWGAPLLAKADRKDAFCTHWLSLPLKLHLTDQAPGRPTVTIELRTGDEPMTIEAANGTISTRLGSAQNPDAVLTGIPHLVLGVLTGRLDLAKARAAGLQYDGDPAVLRRVQPKRHTRGTTSEIHSPAK
jgi:DNA-binding HxlR family transcriptional regulator